MPRIGRHIEAKLDQASLELYGFDDHVIAEIQEVNRSRKEITTQPVMLAAHALEPRFHGSDMTDIEWKIATTVILTVHTFGQLNHKSSVELHE